MLEVFQMLGPLLIVYPLLLVCLVGAIVSLDELKRSRRSAVLTLVSCVSFSLLTAATPYVLISRPSYFLVSILVLLFAATIALLLVAVFTGRRIPVVPTGAADDTHVKLATDYARASLILILGFLSSVVWAWVITGNEITRFGLLVCGPLGIAAWVIASNDLAAMRAGRIDPSAQSLTRAGQILGIIGTVLFAVGIAAGVWDMIQRAK